MDANETRTPSFDTLAMQESERLRRLVLIVAVILGPSVLLGLFGFVNAAGIAFAVSIISGYVLVAVFPRADHVTAKVPGLSGNEDLWLAAFVLLFEVAISTFIERVLLP